MTAPRKVTREQVRKEPHIIWNQFVDLLAMSDYDQLTPKQRAAQLVFWYYNEVENGGHLQYFENRGPEHAALTIKALKILGAERHARVLVRALARFNSKKRSRIKSVEEYVETAQEVEFASFDQKYAECQPELDDVLKRFLAKHQAYFVVED